MWFEGFPMLKANQNPGWLGPGIPSFRSLLAAVPRALITKKVKTPAEAVHLLFANLADMWNFYIYPTQRVSCPCCGWKGRGFRATSNWRAVTYHSRCPNCDSRSRHRGLSKYMVSNKASLQQRKVLVFAPEKVILESLQGIGVGKVVTTDYIVADVDLPQQDIQALSIESGSFDLLICNHVLEHVPDDQAAIKECARVLTENGIGLFTIPGDFNKKETWHFKKTDSNGHYRHYGLDVVEKLQQAFAHVDIIDMSTLALQAEHVRQGDILFACRKR